MFAHRTVVLTGAGASWHYGLPTGEQLVERVLDRADRLAQYCHFARTRGGLSFLPKFMEDVRFEGDPSGYLRVQQDCIDLRDRLRSANPLVIDYFLAHNSPLERIGKLLIAWDILAADEDLNIAGRNPQRLALVSDADRARIPPVSRADDWMKFFTHALTTDCATADDLIANKLLFVTFNYDTIIERRLRESLTALFPEETVARFMRNRVFHVYGDVGLPISRIANFDWNASALEANKNILDALYAQSSGIKIIEPFTKDQVGVEQAAIKHMIAQAHRLFVLGYGFDQNNNGRIGLMNGIRTRPSDLDQYDQKQIFVTNFQDYDRINKRLGQLVLGQAALFTKNRIHQDSERVVEKSSRSVFDALAFDFETYDFSP